jgi:hypothetical protein
MSELIIILLCINISFIFRLTKLFHFFGNTNKKIPFLIFCDIYTVWVLSKIKRIFVYILRIPATGAISAEVISN